MSAPRGVFARVVQTEAKLAIREPVGIVWGFGMPVILVVIFGNIGPFADEIPGSGGMSVFDAYLPVLCVVALTMLALIGLPMPLATYRELGVLRRMATTPVSPARLLGAQVVLNLVVGAAAVVLVLGVGSMLGGQLPSRVPAFVLVLLLTAWALFALGLVVAAVARTSRAAAALGNVLFFPLAFFGGLWLPLPAMPQVLQGISSWIPTGAAVEAMNATVRGDAPPLVSLLLLLGYGAVFGAVAWRTFRWE
ncbi:ABC transporter permease [Actinotalea sp. M2MS4P-6]|uniref:ABC transporter permease n=1 Tax=Actinotalea sp. M2MS4P-6 TaxID=2983762 RepID=UPI0021E4A7C9|nr:ABC transporter permease [Actinotalea sp. M2MS4P-6]MCV2394655.1 ABC transporter permease [Actinotalea sp. M2MS4P-6]